jgi:predicted glycosyltransferase
MHLARAVQSANVDCRILTGCSVLDPITSPAGIQIERLAPVRLDGLSMVAVNPADGLRPMEHRAKRITAFVRSFCPDVVVVDHLPFGLTTELLPCLDSARREGWTSRFRLGHALRSRQGRHRPEATKHSTKAL